MQKEGKQARFGVFPLAPALACLSRTPREPLQFVGDGSFHFSLKQRHVGDTQAPGAACRGGGGGLMTYDH